MNDYRRALIHASYLCWNYAEMLAIEKPDFANVALECAAIIDDASQQADFQQRKKRRHAPNP